MGKLETDFTALMESSTIKAEKGKTRKWRKDKNGCLIKRQGQKKGDNSKGKKLKKEIRNKKGTGSVKLFL